MVVWKTAKEIIILMSVSVVLAVVVNNFSPRGIPLVEQWDVARGAISANPNETAGGKSAEIDRIALAREIFDSGDVLFVDVRSQDDYEAGHIPGAESLPVGKFDERIASFLKRYPPEQPIVTYCAGRTCEDSHTLAQLLSGAGFSNVRIFIDGFPGWRAEGHPIE